LTIPATPPEEEFNSVLGGGLERFTPDIDVFKRVAEIESASGDTQSTSIMVASRGQRCQRRYSRRRGGRRSPWRFRSTDPERIDFYATCTTDAAQ
jgi:hypothetical protein